MTPLRISTIAIFCVVVANGSCQQLNGNYCEDAPHHNCYYPTDANAQCQTDQDCMNAEGKVCDTSSGHCVQCTMSNPAACGGTKPACGTNNTCATCSEHTQCTSNVCTPEESCAPENTVAYVAPNGLGTECKKNSPCGELSDAIDKHRIYIKISKGILRVNNIKLRSQNIILLADPGARIIAIEGTAPRVSIFDVFDSSSLHIYDLEISNARSNGIFVNSEAPPIDRKYNVLLVRSSIDSNTEHGLGIPNGIISIKKSLIFGNTKSGIQIAKGILTIEESAIFSNGDTGIELPGGEGSSSVSLTLTRSSILTNEDGGISIAASSTGSRMFDISNNFIVRNGTQTSNTGGLSFNNSSGILKFNTIVDNTSSSGSEKRAGIFCNSNVTLNNASDNIVFRNQTGSNFDSQISNSNSTNSNNCNLTSSLNRIIDSDIQNTRPPDDIHFVQSDSPPYDYHLTSISPNVGNNAVISAAHDCSGVDFDGDTRPSTGCDLGADEYKH